MAATSKLPGRYAPVIVLAVTLLVFAVVVAYLTLWLRTGLRQQILEREGEALTAVASLQLAIDAAEGASEVPGALLTAVLKTSKLRGVFAVRVFDADRRYSGAVPIDWSEDPPKEAVWNELNAGKPVVQLHARESAAEVLGLVPVADSGSKEPLLETWLPLRKAEAAKINGAAQLWTDGKNVAREFAALDRRLITQAVVAWFAGALIIGTLLSWAFSRLAYANRALQIRTDDLLRANRELTLVAKTSALGAVTAHLMHELKNPLAGLEEFVASQAEADSGDEVAAASALTKRLRTMINDVAGVLQDEHVGGAHFTLSVDEVAELAVKKARPIADHQSVALRRAGNSPVELSARRANLVRLVLHNLLQNAIEATPAGKSVILEIGEDCGATAFKVIDEGEGLPPAARERLFQPCASTKRGGSGIGLALSQQLARQVDAKLSLVRTGAQGTCFQLTLVPEPGIG